MTVYIPMSGDTPHPKALYQDMTQWMANLPTALQEIPLNHLAIPGSHDSGTFHLTTEMSPSASGILKFLASLPGYAKLLGNIVLENATCQTLTIGDQLTSGIRYLDFRVSTKAKQSDLYFVHSVYGTKVKDSLIKIKNFLDKYEKEVVILDLQKFHNMDSSSHKAFMALLKSIFGAKLCQQTDMNSLTLKHLWNNKKQVICIYQDEAASGDNAFWSSDVIDSPWPNTPSPTTCVQKLTEYMDQAKDVPDRLFVCQAVVTPDAAYILSHCGGSIHKMTQELNPVFFPWLSQSPSRWKHQPNIVIHDFVQEEGYVQNVLDLNKHRM